ncbi:MAG: Fe-S cluster assembly protein SufD [Aggregatilineales bacterium]
MLSRTRTAKLQAPVLTRADVETFSQSRNEPGWLTDTRLAAWSHYESLPMPSLQAEEWRRTDYTKIDWASAGVLAQPRGIGFDVIPAENRVPLVGERQGGLLAFVDGQPVHHEIDSALTAQGVIFTDLQTAVREHEALVRANLLTRAVLPTDGKFAALHAALWTHGVFLYVPRGVAAELPLHSIFYNTQTGLSLGHVLVVLEERAQVTFLNEYLSVNDTNAHAAYVGATELLVGDNANLKYVSLQDWGRNVYDFRHERARVSRDGQLDWIMGTMGSRLTKDFAEIELDGEGSWARMSGLFFSDTDQLIDHDTQQNHNAPHTTSDLLFKGALKHNSRSVWQGMIRVLPNAQKTDGFQANRNLLLSEKARADSIPGLEILANDVRCTHAATVGKLEEEPVFYLMSRGIPRTEAEKLLVVGFFDPIMERIPFQGVRDRLAQHIEQKLSTDIPQTA